MSAEPGEPLVELEGVSFGYRRQHLILEDISLVCHAGQVHAITGPSGCGKSTLLYIAGLMLRPSSGCLRICSYEAGGASDAKRAALRASSLGFVFQDALLEPSMNVMESVLEAVALRRRPSRYRQVASDHLERLGLSGLADRKTARLSGGQAQRVALVRALLKQPTVILADEPTGNLDDSTAALVLNELYTYGRQPDHASIIVTHDERVAEGADVLHRLDAAWAPHPNGAGAEHA